MTTALPFPPLAVIDVADGASGKVKGVPETDDEDAPTPAALTALNVTG